MGNEHPEERNTKEKLVENIISLGCYAAECLFFCVPGPGTVDSQGQIEFLECYATLKTKSQTKFYLEFHSSCLESKWPLNCLSSGAGHDSFS
jgi:hypothetical protein